MAKIEKKQSEIEKALNLAYEIYKSSLQTILGVDTLTVEVEVTGVKLSTLAIIVEEGEGLELNVYNGLGTDLNESHSDLKFGDITLVNIKTY